MALTLPPLSLQTFNKHCGVGHYLQAGPLVWRDRHPASTQRQSSHYGPVKKKTGLEKMYHSRRRDRNVIKISASA